MSTVEWNKVTWYSWLATLVAALAFTALISYLYYVRTEISLEFQRAVRTNVERARLPVLVMPRTHSPQLTDNPS